MMKILIVKIATRRWAAVAIVFLAAVLVVGCSPVSFNVHANGTVSPAHGSHPASRPRAASSAPPTSSTASASPDATVTVTATPATTPTATQTAAVTSAQVQQCLTPVTGSTPQRQTMLQLESAQAWGNLGGCLQVPTAQFNQFAVYAARLVIEAAADGQLADTQHCRDWVDGTLTPVVQRYDRE
jgi:cytoskeletal protein RodZ